MVSANPTEPASKRSSPFAAGGQQHDPHVSRITPASARPPRLSANQERGLHRHQRRSVCAQSHRHGSDRQTDRPERAPNSRRSGSPPSPECSRAAAFCRPSSARAETTPEAAATNANANRGHRLKLELKSVFQLAEEGCRCHHTQEDNEFQGVRVVVCLMRCAGPHANVGWRMLGAKGRVEQRPLGAADCVEIVVMVPGPARDFWREMPSGNAPVPPVRLH